MGLIYQAGCEHISSQLFLEVIKQVKKKNLRILLGVCEFTQTKRNLLQLLDQRQTIELAGVETQAFILRPLN